MMNISTSVVGVGWHVRKLVSTLSFADGEADVWLVERWTVVAEVTLDELLVELNLDDPRPSLFGEAGMLPKIDVHGAEMTTDIWERSGSDRTVLGIRLPSPLVAGATHDFELILPMPRPDRIRRHVYLPAVPCRRLDLRIHFSSETAPATVTRVAGIPTGSGPYPLTRIPLDRCREVAVTFRDLRPGATYGMSWAEQHHIRDHGQMMDRSHRHGHLSAPRPRL